VAKSTGEELTAILARLSEGDDGARSELWELTYQELRRIARGQMARERPGRTLQPTGLVHEAYLRLTAGAEIGWQNRAHFYTAAAEAMRRILIERARRRTAAKRGGGAARVPLDEAEVAGATEDERLVELDEALSRLAERDPRRARVVELRFFGGLTEEQVARVLEVSPRTVRRLWTGARAWLHREIGGEELAAPG
jgi:RNA polymerase sigma factor (TIGR02999 family)